MVQLVVAMAEGRPQEEGVAAQVSIGNVILVYQMLGTFLKCLVATSKATSDFGSLAREIREAEHGLGILFNASFIPEGRYLFGRWMIKSNDGVVRLTGHNFLSLQIETR